MKKLLIVSCASVLLIAAPTVKAQVVKLYRMSMMETAFVGGPHTQLPSSMYLIVDSDTNAFVAGFNSTRASLPYPVTFERFGPGSSFSWVYRQSVIPVVEGTNVVAQRHLNWEMAGQGSGTGLLPNQYDGILWFGRSTGTNLVFTSSGYGTAKASLFRIFTDNTASNVAVSVYDALLNVGYLPWEPDEAP